MLKKNYPRPKRPMKANKGQQSPKLQKNILLSLFNVKSSINVNKILKKCVFIKSEIFIFITYINFLKLYFVEYIKFSKSFQWNNDTGSFICLYITWQKWKIIHKFPPMEILLKIWWKSLHRNSRYCQNHQNVTSCFPKMIKLLKKMILGIELDLDWKS